MRQYDISFSAIFALAHGTPYVVQCEGETGLWNFKTEHEARDFVANRKDGIIRKVSTGEERIYGKMKAA
jgi:hypothetical protein